MGSTGLMSKQDIELTVRPVEDASLFEHNISEDDELHVCEVETSKVTGTIPRVAFFLCLVEFSERFSYYIISGCLTNMIQRGFPKDSTSGAVVHNVSSSVETPGALNLGLPMATLTMQVLTFFANISPIISGYYSDTKLGKVKSVWLGTIIGIVGHFTLVISSIPVIMAFPHFSFAILLVSVATIAVSAGFIKSNLLPLLLDQYEHKQDRPDYTVLSNGSRLKIDHKATLEKLSMHFYMYINWGCALALIGSFMERYMGFWPVYLWTALIFLSLPLLLKYLNNRIINVQKKEENINTRNSYRVFYYHLKKHFLNTPIPLDSSLTISKSDIENFLSCTILFLFFIPFYLNDSALISIQISLAATMSTSVHLPNDFYQAFNPLSIIVLIPILSGIVYPYLLKINRLPSSRKKIIIGFTLTSIGTLLGAYTQNEVYKNSKCELNMVSSCETPSHVSTFAWFCYISMFMLQAIGECFAVTTCYELAYELSPVFLRGGVMAIFLSSVATSSILGEILSVWARDPYLVDVFIYTGSLGLISTVIFTIWSKRIGGLEQPNN